MYFPSMYIDGMHILNNSKFNNVKYGVYKESCNQQQSYENFETFGIVVFPLFTEFPKFYRKSVLHLLKYRFET